MRRKTERKRTKNCYSAYACSKGKHTHIHINKHTTKHKTVVRYGTRISLTQSLLFFRRIREEKRTSWFCVVPFFFTMQYKWEYKTIFRVLYSKQKKLDTQNIHRNTGRQKKSMPKLLCTVHNLYRIAKMNAQKQHFSFINFVV